MPLGGDFDAAVMDEQGHRPFPVSNAPWIMTQSWHDLLFAHWPLRADAVAECLPPGFEVDRFDGDAWIGITPFHLTNVAPRLTPALPFVSAFPELNVRTYVRVGGTPGVCFFSLDAGSPLVVPLARALFHLPYFSAAIAVDEDGRRIRYSCRRRDESAPRADFEGEYEPVGDASSAARGTLEYFLTERYCLFTIDRANTPYRVDIHHRAWRLFAAEADIRSNTMAKAAGLRLPDAPPLLHYARRQDVLVWPPAAVT